MTSPSNTQSNTQSNPAERATLASYKASRSFFIGLLAIALILLTAGIGAFWYLTANGPLALLSKIDRPIAVATAFVPAKAPFAFSLLASPDQLVARQQALPDADTQQVVEAARSIEQAFFKDSSLNYDRDIRPWVGNEITIACTQLDIDRNANNGQQPGYLLAVDIAPMRSQQARESLQRYWQVQSLSGNSPQSERLDGVRLLYSDWEARSPKAASNASPLGTASALVGNRFVLFANDARVIRHSLRATETATNLAQDRAYRTAADSLPKKRLGLAHLSTALLSKAGQDKSASSVAASKLSPGFVTASLELAPTGLAFTAQLPDSLPDSSLKGQPATSTTALLKLIPADSAIALTSQNLSQLESTLAATGLSVSLPDFLKLQAADANGDSPIESISSSEASPAEASPWKWAKGDYAIAQRQTGKADWILVLERSAEGIAQIEELVKSKGYNAIPLAIGEQKAIAWTKFKARTQRRQSSTLETEILGLHLQQSDSQSDYEIFASSIAAMDDALTASANPLSSDPRFVQAFAELKSDSDRNLEGYLYLDWAAAAALAQSPAFKQAESVLRPITRQFDTLAATKSGRTVNLFIHFKPSSLEPSPLEQSRP